jgi:hypothetical protein
MQTGRTGCSVRITLWTVQRTWFWSLVYPDRQGGAIGAAATEAEAVREAQAVIERVPALREMKIACDGDDESSFTRLFQNSTDSQVYADRKLSDPNHDFGWSRAADKRQAKIQALEEHYDDLWQSTLQHYAARVASA